MDAPAYAEQVPRSLYTADLDSDEELDDDEGDEEVSLVTSPPSSLPRTSSPPPPSSHDTDTESVQNVKSKGPLSLLLMALGLWCEKSSISRTEYRQLREVWEMAQAIGGIQAENNEMLRLLLHLDSLKRSIYGYLPMLRMLRKPITVTLEKQATMPEKTKNPKEQRTTITRQAWHYWYDPLDLLTKILSTEKLQSKMHFGMAEYSDSGDEFWNSRVWGSSAITTSREFARTTEGEIIIPGNIIRFTGLVEGYSKGRVILVGRDFRSCKGGRFGPRGGIVLTIQPVMSTQEFEGDSPSLLQKELILIDETLEIPPSMAKHLIEVVIEWMYDPNSEEANLADLQNRFFIRYIYNPAMALFKSIRYMPPIRRDLEVDYYGRESIEAFASTDQLPSISLLFILFIDDFGIYCNMYRALKGFYITLAALGYKERRKPSNEFTLTLGPHGISIDDIVRNLEPGLSALGKGTKLIVSGTSTLVKAFPIVLTGDMPQNADSSGFMRHGAAKGCRACFVDKSERGDIYFDIIEYGRFHWDIIFLREQGSLIENDRERAVFFTERGMREDPPPIAHIAPCLDLILGRGYDAPHSEWRGIGYAIFGVLFNTILTKGGCNAFIKAMQLFPFPNGWPRIQSPFYLFSWSLSETGRALIILPLILHCYGRNTWYKLRYLNSLSKRTGEDRPIKALINLLNIIAHILSETTQRWEEPRTAEEAAELVLASQTSFKILIQAAETMHGKEVDMVADDDNDNDDGNNNVSGPEEGLPSMLDINEQWGEYTGETDDEEEDVAPLKKKPTKWEKLRSLPNVHVGLHLADNIREYGYIMNTNVLSGEMTHA
jgi:hypothetical protein